MTSSASGLHHALILRDVIYGGTGGKSFPYFLRAKKVDGGDGDDDDDGHGTRQLRHGPALPAPSPASPAGCNQIATLALAVPAAQMLIGVASVWRPTSSSFRGSAVDSAAAAGNQARPAGRSATRHLSAHAAPAEARSGPTAVEKETASHGAICGPQRRRGAAWLQDGLPGARPRHAGAQRQPLWRQQGRPYRAGRGRPEVWQTAARFRALAAASPDTARAAALAPFPKTVAARRLSLVRQPLSYADDSLYYLDGDAFLFQNDTNEPDPLCERHCAWWRRAGTLGSLGWALTSSPALGAEPMPRHAVVMSQPDPCAYVAENCTSDSIIDYNTFHYCTMQDVPWLSYIILVRPAPPCEKRSRPDAHSHAEWRYHCSRATARFWPSL